MALFFILLSFVQFFTSNGIVIDTRLGKIEGIKDEFGQYLFRNIPYATPPIGPLRFKPPKPFKNQKFKGTFDATLPGNACVQGSMGGAMMTNGSNGNMSEDCLTLGIHTPYDFDQSKRKVLFWIHGGGLAAGTGYTYFHSNLPRDEDIVVVSVNYRLGIGAWLVDPQSYNSPTGNGGANGFLDMIAALKWVRENIACYGGDPEQITIAGESGGGWAVCGLVLSPLAKGLFKRSIQMSGTCIESLGKFFSREEAWDMAQEIKTSVNATRFDELRSMDLGTIIDTFAMSGKNLLPSIDGYVFPKSTFELLESGYANGESTMIGLLFRESFTEKPFNMGIPPQSFDELNDYYDRKLFDTQAQLLREYYPENEVYSKIWTDGKSAFESNVASLIQTVQTTDCWVKCGSVWQADMMASNPITKASFPVYFYQYGYIKQPYDEVSHGYDMIGLFGEDISWINGGTEYSPEFTKLTQNYFGNYIRDGVVPMKDGKSASVQNGYYIQVVEEVKVVGNDELDVVRDRCEVYKLFGDSIWRNSFCMGIYMEDMTPEMMEQWGTPPNATETEQCADGACEA